MPRREPDDGQPNPPRGGHAELPGGGERDYFVWLLSMMEARTDSPLGARFQTAAMPLMSHRIGLSGRLLAGGTAIFAGPLDDLR